MEGCHGAAKFSALSRKLSGLHRCNACNP
jgi:hypothetical protein